MKQFSLDRWSIESLVATDVVLAKLAGTFLAPRVESARARKNAIRDSVDALFDRVADACHGEPTKLSAWGRKWLDWSQAEIAVLLRRRMRIIEEARFAYPLPLVLRGSDRAPYVYWAGLILLGPWGSASPPTSCFCFLVQALYAKLEHSARFRRGPIGRRMDALAAMACWLEHRHAVQRLTARSLVATWAVGTGVWPVTLKNAKEQIAGVELKVHDIGGRGDGLRLGLTVGGRPFIVSQELTVVGPVANRSDPTIVLYRDGSESPWAMGEGTLDRFRPPRKVATDPVPGRIVVHRTE